MKRKIPKGYKKGGVTSAKAKEILKHGYVNGKSLTAKQKKYFGWIAGGRKMQRGGPPPTLQSRMNEKQMEGWKQDLDFWSNYAPWEEDPKGFTPEQIKAEKATSAKKVAELQRYIGVTDENRNTWTEGDQTFTYNPEKDQKKREAAIRDAYGMDKEISTDPMPGVSNIANASSGFAAASYAKADAQKQTQANQLVSDVTKNSAIGASPLKLEVERERAKQEGYNMTSDVNYAGRGAVEGGLKGVAMGANFGPIGAIVGGVLGAGAGAATGAIKKQDLAFAEDARKKKEKGRLLGIQDEIRRNIDTTEEENPTIVSVNVRKGGKVKMQNGGTIIGPGTGTSDNISGQLEPNDFVAIASKRREADTIRRKYGLPNQKATLKKGGNAMRKIPVKVSNGETLFTNREIKHILAQGGTLDELNALAPNADVPLQDGGKPSKYGTKEEDWYYGLGYIGNDPIVKKKIEAEKLQKEIDKLILEMLRESAKTPKNIIGSDDTKKYLELGKQTNQLRRKLTAVNKDLKNLTTTAKMDTQKQRLNKSEKDIKNQVQSTRNKISKSSDPKEIEKLGKLIEDLDNKNDKLKLLKAKLGENDSSPIKNKPQQVKKEIDDIMGVEKTSKQPTETITEDFDITETTDFDGDDLEGAGVLKLQDTTTGVSTLPTTSKSKKPPTKTGSTPPSQSSTATTKREEIPLIENPLLQGLSKEDIDKMRKEQSEKDIAEMEALRPEVKAEEKKVTEKEEKVTEKEELPWSDILGIAQAGMGVKGLSEDQRPIGEKSADLAAQQARIDASESGFTYPIDETLRQIEGERRAASIPTSGERGYEFAKRVAAQDVASSQKAKALERKSIVEGQAADRFGLTKLGLQGQMAGALAAQDRMLFQDDMQAFQQKQAAYLGLLNAGISNFIQGREARATRKAMKDIEGDTIINIR